MPRFFSRRFLRSSVPFSGSSSRTPSTISSISVHVNRPDSMSESICSKSSPILLASLSLPEETIRAVLPTAFFKPLFSALPILLRMPGFFLPPPSPPPPDDDSPPPESLSLSFLPLMSARTLSNLPPVSSPSPFFSDFFSPSFLALRSSAAFLDLSF